MIDLASLGAISETALTRDAAITFEKNGLPNTFVPGRNLLFFTYAAALAYRRDIADLVGGMCETDYSGYPDCREATLKALETAINLGIARDFIIHTPLMHIDKAATWRMAEELGGEALVELIKNETHTCYLGERGKRHEWGYGCGECPACALRANGYRGWKEKKGCRLSSSPLAGRDANSGFSASKHLVLAVRQNPVPCPTNRKLTATQKAKRKFFCIPP